MPVCTLGTIRADISQTPAWVSAAQAYPQLHREACSGEELSQGHRAGTGRAEESPGPTGQEVLWLATSAPRHPEQGAKKVREELCWSQRAAGEEGKGERRQLHGSAVRAGQHLGDQHTRTGRTVGAAQSRQLGVSTRAAGEVPGVQRGADSGRFMASESEAMS